MPSYLPHYSYTDYCQWQGDWELYGGIPIAMTASSFGRHQQCVTRLLLAIGGQLAAGTTKYEALVELDWVVDDDTVVRPDLLVIAGEVPEKHLHAAPVLTAEILSASSRDRDTQYKVDLYRESGVKRYLIVDPDESSIEHHNYADQTRRKSTSGTLEIALAPQTPLTIHLNDLFR